MGKQNFKRFQYNHCIYFKKTKNGNYVILLLYVDDILVIDSCMKDIIKLKNKLKNTFFMKDFREAKKLLDMRITRDKEIHKLKLSQEEFIEKVLKWFNMNDAKVISIPLEK